MAEFNPARLVLARERRRLSQSEFANLARLTRRAVVKIEREHAEPTADSVARFCTLLRFPETFFYREDPPDLSIDAASFRALSYMSARDRDCARACGVLAIEFCQWIASHFTIPAPSVPMLSFAQPEEAARELREVWQLGERPIRNLTHLLESRGVRIFSISEFADNVDAFSFWHDGIPFIMLNTLKSGEHSRFDLAHELGHLVLHRRGSPRGRPIESEAHAFASSFLMPTSEVVANVPRNTSLSSLIRLKTRWGVSLIALVHRLAALNLVSEWKGRHLYIEIAKHGYRKQEPNPMPRESSQLLGKVLGFVRGSGGGLRRISSDLALPVTELDRLAFGLATVGLQGGGSQKSESGRPQAERPQLKVLSRIT